MLIKVINQSFFRICNKSVEAENLSFHGLLHILSRREKCSTSPPLWTSSKYSLHYCGNRFLVIVSFRPQSCCLWTGRPSRKRPWGTPCCRCSWRRWSRGTCRWNRPLQSSSRLLRLHWRCPGGRILRGLNQRLFRHVKDQMTLWHFTNIKRLWCS